jgi:hypothetical protein
MKIHEVKDSHERDLYLLQWFCTKYDIKNFEIKTEKRHYSKFGQFDSLTYTASEITDVREVAVAEPKIDYNALMEIVRHLYFTDIRTMSPNVRNAYDDFYVLRAMSE